MAKSRRANAVNFGFDFQVNAAIVLMLENIEDVSALRLEGNYEDIEVKLNDGEYILAQAKSIEKSSTDFHNVRKNLKKALESLSEGAQKCNASELILITNSPNPMNDDSINIFTLDAHRPYSSLPVSSQELVNEYLKQINQPLDTSKFMIQVLPFETDIDAERYKFVRRAVDDFIGNLNVSIPGLSNQILTIWQNDVFHNSTKIVGTGSISSFWGSKTESILLTIFVLPEFHGKGIGRKIINTLEQDEFYVRATRIEIPASITATEFYRKFGYDYKNGVKELDEEHHYRLEKFKEAGQ